MACRLEVSFCMASCLPTIGYVIPLKESLKEVGSTDTHSTTHKPAVGSLLKYIQRHNYNIKLKQ